MSSRSRNRLTDKPESPARTSIRQTWSLVAYRARKLFAPFWCFTEALLSRGTSMSHQVFRGIQRVTTNGCYRFLTGLAP